MKTYDFDDKDGRERYELLYEGLSATQKQLTYPERRSLDRIMTRLEKIGKPRDDSFLFTLLQPSEYVLEDAELVLVLACLEQVPWMNGIYQRRAGKLEAWLRGDA